MSVLSRARQGRDSHRELGWLQVLEDGRLTDSQGRVVSFKNTLVVMTSNVGSQVIAKGGNHQLGFALPTDDADGGAYVAMREKVMDELRGFFRPELLNRLDEVVVFRQLMQEEVRIAFIYGPRPASCALCYTYQQPRQGWDEMDRDNGNVVLVKTRGTPLETRLFRPR